MLFAAVLDATRHLYGPIFLSLSLSSTSSPVSAICFCSAVSMYIRLFHLGNRDSRRDVEISDDQNEFFSFVSFQENSMSESSEPSLTHDIEWSMLDKRRYVPLSLLSTFTVRSLLYPFTLVRTRLQVQVQSSIYKGTWHALTTTVRYEGFRSLYKGFLVYNCQLLPGLIYITTFEATRAQANLLTRNEYLRAGIGGTVASLFSQILACPIDVISQHMQLVGLTSPGKVQSGDNAELSEKKGSTSKSAQRQIRRIHVPEEIRNSNYQIFRHICRTLFYENATADPNRSHFSLRGFYRGYMISTFLFSLTSAIWWPSYYFYQRQMLKVESMFRK